MFSPSLREGGPATATRSRRRQRPLSSDSISQQPKAKRQRSALTENTFTNPDAPPEMIEVKSDKVAKLKASNKLDSIRSPSPAAARNELTVRSKKPKPGERISKGDGSVVLTTNNAYTVSKLPALPDRLRGDAKTRQHGAIYASSGHAMCLTHTHALVWPYTETNSSPETFTFALPYPSRHASDPLPLGSLVAPAASNDDPGLVVVMPTTGKMTYWESITSAATLEFLRASRTGVEDTVPGMMSGETITQLVNAEPAGFVLVFSSGRLAYMSVRDGHGRPAISVQFLRTGLAATSGGFFGSIRHALQSSAIRGDVAAVKAGPVTKVGERTIVAATSKGKFHSWSLHRGGNHDSLAEVDCREAIIQALRQSDRTIDSADAESMEVVDFTFVPKDIDQRHAEMTRLSSATQADDQLTLDLVALVSLSSGRKAPYSLVELVISAGSAVTVGMVRDIKSYTSLPSKSAIERPRLYLPRPALVAYIVFDRAVVVASIAHPPESPESQLQEDSHVLPATFEDVIDLRHDASLQIVGSGIEESQSASTEVESSRSHRHKAKNPSAVFMVPSVGVIRVMTTDIDRFGSDKPPQVTAKVKLEQAVFFGIKDDNPLVFEGRSGPQFSDEELSRAALELSHEILSSSTPYMTSLPASLEQNMRARLSALDKLMSHLKALNANLSRATRWALLWNAEKMETATRLWVQHEQFLADRAEEKGSEGQSLVAEIVTHIHEDEKRNLNRSIGELDSIRHFFLHDVWRLEIFIAWAYEVIKNKYKEKKLGDRGMTRLLYEGIEVNSHGIKGALAYRRHKLSFYGLQGEDMEDDILVSGYEELSEPWTATLFITNNSKRLAELCCSWLESFYPPQATTTGPDPGLLEAIRENLPQITDQYLVALQEHARWAMTRDDPQVQQFGEKCVKTYREDRYTRINILKKYDLWDEAIEVAAKHHSLEAMAEVMVEHVEHLRRKAAARGISKSASAELYRLAEDKKQLIPQFFQRYREPFAFCVFEILIRTEGIQSVLDFRGDKNRYATKFLRTKPELAKISWINDIEREKDIDRAATTLLKLGLDEEQQVWHKKIELSLGKLALLAEQETSAQNTKRLITSADAEKSTRYVEEIEKVNRHLEMIKVQDALYAIIYPTISTAVDEAAELMLAMDNHEGVLAKKQKTLHRMFERAMGRLIKHEALDPMTLIDLLTLISLPNEGPEPDQDTFAMALEMAQLLLSGEERKRAQQLIWRRCLIQDDWTKINNTQNKDDRATAAALEATALWRATFVVLLDKAPTADEGDKIPYMVPSEVLGVFTNDLDSRFNNEDASAKEKILEAMKWEDAVLRRYVEKARLDNWQKATLEAATRRCENVVDEETVNGASSMAEVVEEQPAKATNGRTMRSRMNGKST